MSQLEAFLLTLLLEAPCAALGARWLFTTKATKTTWAPAWAAAAAVIGSLVTHPFVWWGNEHWALVGGGWPAKIAVLELGAVVVESVGYALLARLSWSRALLLSAAVNGFSFGVGILWALLSR